MENLNRVEGITIKVPVTVMNDYCAECPNMDIGTALDFVYGNGETIVTTRENYCKNIDQCKELVKFLRTREEHGLK